MINIFILNWNSAKATACLMATISQSKFRNFRVLLIHNASNDEDEIISIFKQYQNELEMHLIINSTNYGYAGGNNRGLEYLQSNDLEGDLLILNPDITLELNTIGHLIDAKQQTNAGAVMVRTFDDKGAHLYDRIELNDFKQNFKYSSSHICDSDYAAGSCLLLDRNTINNIGLFDDAYFMYWEEVDLSLRIKKYGRRIISVTNTFITRKTNPYDRSVGSIFYLVRNSFLLKKRFQLSNIKHCYYLIHLFLFASKQLLLKGSFLSLRNFFRGLWSGIS